MTNSRANVSKVTSVVAQNDQTVTNDATPLNDTELVLPVKANTSYTVILTIFHNSATAADISYDFVIPSGASLYRNNGIIQSSQTSTADAETQTDDATTGNVQIFVLHMQLIVSTTAGTIQFQFSNDIAAGNTIREKGSSMMLIS